jgi:hypothetical protein
VLASKLVGPVRTLADPEFTILGARVLTTLATEFDDIERDAFFNEGIGRLSKSRVSLSGEILVADEIEPVDD